MIGLQRTYGSLTRPVAISFIKIYFFGALLYKGKQCKRLGYGLQFSSYVSSVVFWSLVWDGNLNKEITSTDSEEQPLYSLVLSSCDVYFLLFSVVILEVFFQFEP